MSGITFTVIFSIAGTTYGMLEETVGFYALLAAAMVMAGMDTVVSSAIVLLGAGSGVLGSTINPFAVGAAVSALPDNVKVNQGLIIAIGAILWLTTLLISALFVMNYAKKVIKKKGSTILSLQDKLRTMTNQQDRISELERENTHLRTSNSQLQHKVDQLEEGYRQVRDALSSPSSYGEREYQKVA